MLIEYRKIEFPENDLIEAVASHDDATSQRLGTGELMRIEVTGDEITEIVAIVDYPENGGKGSIPLPVSFVTAAMIRYCMDEGIPVPKRGRKDIEVNNGTFSLIMRMTKGTIADDPDEDEADIEAA